MQEQLLRPTNRRIVSSVIVYAKPKTGKKASPLWKLFRKRSLARTDANFYASVLRAPHFCFIGSNWVSFTESS